MTAQHLYNHLGNSDGTDRRHCRVLVYNSETDNYHEATDAYYSDVDGSFIIRI